MSPAVPAALPLDLEQPLPDAITGRDQGWLTRYRRYAVFSPPWARGRARTLGVVTTAVAALLLVSALIGAPGDRPFGAGLQALLGVLVPLFAGPALGCWVRRRAWPAGVEGRALTATMLATVLAMAAFHEWGAEPIKQAIAEATGMVDAQGQRRRVALTIGVTVRAPDGAASTAAPRPPSSIAASAPPSSPSASPPESSSAPPSALPPDQPGTTADDPLLDTRPHWTSRVMTALATFTLAGGFALPRWRREREELAALALEREVARADAARREAELRLSVLAAQVEPHFLFNTLAGVRSAIATDPARASQMIDRLTEYLRAAIPRLRSDGRAEATLGNQLDIVRAYLALMSARMPRLRFSIDVPTELLPLPFPPLMLISLAENAVKHGAETKIGPVRIEVGAQRIGAGRLQVTMADDGAGFDATGDGGPAAGAGLGLANVRERLAQMYGDHAVLVLRTRAGGGVIASITLPAEA